jgi:hypothetical protein
MTVSQLFRPSRTAVRRPLSVLIAVVRQQSPRWLTAPNRSPSAREAQTLPFAAMRLAVDYGLFGSQACDTAFPESGMRVS